MDIRSAVGRLARGEVLSPSPELLDGLDDLALEYRTTRAGIQLRDSLELLDPDQLLAGLPGEVRLEVHWDIDSTNSRLMAMSAELDKPVICLAERQLAGRGRRGRAWLSPFGRNLYLSLGFGYAGEMSQLTGLSVAVGIQVVSVIRDLGLASAALKWPNDVLTPSGKLAGILVELGAAVKGRIPVVIGVGINVHGRASQVHGIDQPWTTMAEHVVVSRNQLASRLMQRLIEVVANCGQTGFGQFHQMWDNFNVHRGMEIRVTRGATEITGIDAGIDDHGRLLMRTAIGIEKFDAGEVSVRRAT